MGSDETGYGHQNVALGAFEDGFEVLGLGACQRSPGKGWDR